MWAKMATLPGQSRGLGVTDDVRIGVERLIDLAWPVTGGGSRDILGNGIKTDGKIVNLGDKRDAILVALGENAKVPFRVFWSGIDFQDSNVAGGIWIEPRIIWGSGFMETMGPGDRDGTNLIVGILSCTFVDGTGKGLGMVYALAETWRAIFNRKSGLEILEQAGDTDANIIGRGYKRVVGATDVVRVPVFFGAASGPQETSREGHEAYFVDIPFDVDEYL